MERKNRDERNEKVENGAMKTKKMEGSKKAERSQNIGKRRDE